MGIIAKNGFITLGGTVSGSLMVRFLCSSQANTEMDKIATIRAGKIPPAPKTPVSMTPDITVAIFSSPTATSVAFSKGVTKRKQITAVVIP